MATAVLSKGGSSIAQQCRWRSKNLHGRCQTHYSFYNLKDICYAIKQNESAVAHNFQFRVVIFPGWQEIQGIINICTIKCWKLI